MGDILPVHRDVAGIRPAQPAERLDQFRLTIARDARHSDDLAGAHGDARTIDARAASRCRQRQIAHVEQRRAGRDRRARGPRTHRLARHRLRDRARRGFARAHARDHAALAQHRDAVRDRHHLVDLVRDEQDRAAIGDQLPHHAEQPVALLRRQHRGRLVEDQDSRLAVERLENLHALKHANRKPSRRRVGSAPRVRSVRRARRPRRAHAPGRSGRRGAARLP